MRLTKVNVQANAHYTDPTAKSWPGTITNLAQPYFLDRLFINHTPRSPATKTIKAHVYSAKNEIALPKKLKMTPKTLPTIAGNASTVFPASLLSTSAGLFYHFFKIPSSFRGEPSASCLPQRHL